MKTILSIFAVLLSACVPQAGNDSTSNAQASNASSVDMRLASNGCVMSSNAEAVTDYLIGDKQARVLTWNCADYDKHTDKHIDIFTTFDYIDQCYGSVIVSIRPGACSGVAKPIAAPLYQTTLTVDPEGRIGFGPFLNGKYILYYSATVTNTGNVAMYGTQIYVYLNDIQIAFFKQSDDSLREILWPGPTNNNLFYGSFPIQFDTPDVTKGGEYKLTVKVFDALGYETNSESVFVVAR